MCVRLRISCFSNWSIVVNASVTLVNQHDAEKNYTKGKAHSHTHTQTDVCVLYVMQSFVTNTLETQLTGATVPFYDGR